MADLPQALAKAFAFDSTREEQLEAFRPLYDAEVTFQDPIQRADGFDAFFKMNRRLLRSIRTLTVKVTAVEGTDEQFFLAWTMQFTPKLLPRKELALEGLTHCKARNQKIIYHRDYWDVAALVASVFPGGQTALRSVLARLF